MTADGQREAPRGQQPSAAAAAPTAGGDGAFFTGWLLAVLLIAAAVRFWPLDFEDYWLDELHALLNSAGRRGAFEALPYGEILRDVPRHTDLDTGSTPAAVWRGMRDDSHPPLYFEALYLWRRWLGAGELATRSLSALCSLLSLVPVALLLREYGRPRAGLGAALLLAFAHSHVQMAQQARPYALAILLVSAASWLLAIMDQRWGRLRPARRRLVAGAYTLAVFLSMLTHYFSGLALAGHAIFVLFRFRGRRLAAWLASAACAAALVCAAWGPGLLAQRAFIASQDWVLDQSDEPVRRALLRAADLPLRLLLARPLPDWSASGVWIQAGAGATLAGAALAILALRGVQAGAPAVHFPAAALLALWFFAPAAILIGIDLFTGKELLTHLRYSVIAVPGLAGLLALAAAGLPRPRVVAFGIAAAIAVALTIESPAIRNPDARGAAAVVRQIERPGDLLIFDAQGWIPYWARREFVQVWHYLPESPRHVLMLNAPPSAATREQIAAFERIVVVSPRVEQRPNPAPATHHLAFSSPYLYDIGWVCLFVRDDGWLGGDANPAPAAGVSGAPRHGQAAGRRFPYRGRAWRPLAHATHAVHAIHATHCDPCHPTPSMPPTPPSSAAPQPRVPDTPAPPHSRWEANGPPARQGWSPGSGATRARRFSTSRRCVSSAARRVCRST